MRSRPSSEFVINVRLPDELEAYPVDEAITDDALITRRSMTDVRLGDGRAHLVDLEECRWRGGTLGGSTLTKLTATDQSFVATDLALVKAPEASLTRVRLEQCRLSGLDLAGATAQQVQIEDAVADYLSLRMARLTQVRFDRCRLAHADFGGAIFNQVVFRDCDLSDADFHRVDVRHAWFIDCTWLRTGGGSPPCAEPPSCTPTRWTRSPWSHPWGMPSASPSPASWPPADSRTDMPVNGWIGPDSRHIAG